MTMSLRGRGRREGAEGKGKKERDTERSLINASTHAHIMEFQNCVFALCVPDWYNEEILVRHESFAPFSERISISNLVKSRGRLYE